jgi:hypothetical protein
MCRGVDATGAVELVELAETDAWHVARTCLLVLWPVFPWLAVLWLALLPQAASMNSNMRNTGKSLLRMIYVP